MSLHHLTKKAAIAKYSHLKPKAIELLAALKADEKGFSDEELNELFTEITNPGNPAPEEKPHIAIKHYDKWMGSWIPTKKWRNPGTGKDEVLQWTFERSGTKPNKTNIVVSEEQAKYFNDSRHMAVANVPCEQLFPAGDTTDIVWDLPNPFEIYNI